MKLKDSYLFAVNSVSRIVGQQFDIRLLDYGVTNQQVLTLMAVDENKEIHITGLSKILLTNRTTVHKNLKRLKEKDYVSYVRKRDKNNRLNSLISLTKKGSKLLSSIKGLMEEWDMDFIRASYQAMTPEVSHFNDLYVQNLLVNLHYLGLWKEKEKKS